MSAEQFDQVLAKDVIDGLLDRRNRDAEPVLACIIDAVTEHDRKLLDDLDRLIKEKRKELLNEE